MPPQRSHSTRGQIEKSHSDITRHDGEYRDTYVDLIELTYGVEASHGVNKREPCNHMTRLHKAGSQGLKKEAFSGGIK